MPHETIPSFPLSRAADCPFDPPQHFGTLRAEAPMARVRIFDGQTPWLVTRHSDQRTVLADPRFSADPSKPGYPFSSEGFKAQGAEEVQSFVTRDEPEHGRQRRMFTAYFTVRRVAAMAPRIQEVIDSLLDRVEAAGPPVDLVEEFALPMPSLVISDLLGVPHQDQPLFQRAAQRMIARDSTAEDFTAAQNELGAYLEELVARREVEPADDLLSAVVTERMRTGEITRAELVKTAIALLVAGHETTTNMTALGTLALLHHPDQLAVVRDSDDPARVADAVEELLRYLSITHSGITRVATEDVEVGGQLVRAGEGVIVANASANRDATVFAEPDRFDIGRPDGRRHLAFGHGTHQCLGQNLARKELQLAYPALLRRFPTLRTAVSQNEIDFKHDMLVYGVHALPVTW